MLPLLVATVAVSISIALAPWTGAHVVAAASALWILTVTAFAGLALVRIRNLQTVLLAVATALATIRMSSMGLIQVFGDRPTLFWDVDWRYAATQAHGIARFGDLRDSLDYAGQPVRYHVGPAWMAGALNHVAGIPVNAVLLIAVPAASVVVIALSGFRLLRILGASRDAAALSMAVFLSIPSSPHLLVNTYEALMGQTPVLEALADAEKWYISPNFMLNSLFALSVGLTAACLMVGRISTWQIVLGAVGLASLLAVKPQFFIGFLVSTGLGLLFEWRRDGVLGRRAILVGGSLGLAAAATTILNPTSFSFTGLDFTVGTQILYPLSWILAGSMALVLVLLLAHGRRPENSMLLTIYALGAVVAAVVLVISLGTTTFLVDPEAIGRANEVGLPDTISFQDSNLDQVLIPVTLVLVALATALLIGRWKGSRLASAAVIALIVLIVASPIPLTVMPLAAPLGDTAFDVSEEADLARLMGSVPVEEGRWLSNDLADPGGDYGRPLRGTNLTSFSSAQFYVSNVSYMGWAQPDLVERMRDIQRFFLTHWSDWHERFLIEHDVGYIVIRDRCPVAWPPESAGSLVRTSGSWTLVKAGTATATPSGPAELSASMSVSKTPKYGLSGCLDGSTYAPYRTAPHHLGE